MNGSDGGSGFFAPSSNTIIFDGNSQPISVDPRLVVFPHFPFDGFEAHIIYGRRRSQRFMQLLAGLTFPKTFAKNAPNDFLIVILRPQVGQARLLLPIFDHPVKQDKDRDDGDRRNPSGSLQDFGNHVEGKPDDQ